jgi:hypothetical protein
MAKKARGRPKLNPGERKDDLLQVRVPPGFVGRVRLAAREDGEDVSALVRRLLEEWLRGRDPT